MRQIIREAFDKASAILTEKYDALQTGAKALLDQETLSEDEVIAIFEGKQFRLLAYDPDAEQEPPASTDPAEDSDTTDKQENSGQ